MFIKVRNLYKLIILTIQILEIFAQEYNIYYKTYKKNLNFYLFSFSAVKALTETNVSFFKFN